MPNHAGLLVTHVKTLAPWNLFFSTQLFSHVHTRDIMFFSFCIVFVIETSSRVFRKLPAEQPAVLPGSSEWRHSGQGAELRQPGPHPVDALQPGPPEEDLLLRGGPQQGAIWARAGPG